MHLLEYNNILFREDLDNIHIGRVLINTINAYSFVTASRNEAFQTALSKSNILLPDGISIVMAMKILCGVKLKKIAGADLFKWEMQRLNRINGKCFFLGSSGTTLNKIYNRCKVEYPQVSVQFYSPPFKSSFSKEENDMMVDMINKFSPDVLFIGMTAPKQEKWAADNFDKITAQHVCSIGAVFDFYAGNVKRAPKWVINLGLEWFFRFMQEPRRLWRRYLIGNSKFIYLILKEKWNTSTHKAAKSIFINSKMINKN